MPPQPPEPWNPTPGGISLINKDGYLIDIDGDPSTTSEGAPEGITRIASKLYPYTISILKLEREQDYYQVGDGYPGEYAFVSGVGPQPPNPIGYICHCVMGRSEILLLDCAYGCPPNYRKIVYPILEPRNIRIGIIDLNEYIITDISNWQLEPNPNYRKYIGGIEPGIDGHLLGTSDQGIDFYAYPNLSDAIVYAVNPYEGKVYYFSFLEAVRNPQNFNYQTISLNCFDEMNEPINCTPTDVKVQNVNLFGIPKTLAYITNAGDDSVTVIDTATNTELPYPQSPIFQDYCTELDHYPTSFDARSIGDRGYSSDFYSNTVSVFDLPMSQMNEQVCKIDVDFGPRRIIVQSVNTWEDIFGFIKEILKSAKKEDFTEGPKQDNLVREWENVRKLIKTNASDNAVMAKTEAFRTHINNWVKNNELKKEINLEIDTFKASYTLRNK